MRLIRLENDESRMRIRMFRRQEKIDRAHGRAARFQRQKAAQSLTLRIGIHPVKLFSHSIAGNFRRTAGDDTADFAFAMDIEKLESAFPTHGVLLRKLSC
ncbi:hypothetical protein D3C86_1613890 [compost metagenome]